jgi:hypothetical protein
MPKPISPPIIVDSRSKLLLFLSLHKAENYLEFIDVENGEYEAAYDAEGMRLAITVSINKHWFWGGIPDVKIRPQETEVLVPDELRQKLLAWLPRIKQDNGKLASYDLPQLLALVPDRTYL